MHMTASVVNVAFKSGIWTLFPIYRNRPSKEHPNSSVVTMAMLSSQRLKDTVMELVGVFKQSIGNHDCPSNVNGFLNIPNVIGFYGAMRLHRNHDQQQGIGYSVLRSLPHVLDEVIIWTSDRND